MRRDKDVNIFHKHLCSSLFSHFNQVPMFPIYSFILPSCIYSEGPIKETRGSKTPLPLLAKPKPVSQQNTKVLPLKENFQTHLILFPSPERLRSTGKSLQVNAKALIFPLPSLIFIITRTLTFTRETLFS